LTEIANHIGFGCVGLSAQSTIKAAYHLLDTAYDQGIRFFDTAPLYGNGYSEVILGNFIRNKRNEVTITTKFGLGNNKIPFVPGFVALPLNRLRKRLTKKPALAKGKTIDLPQMYV
jgi:aryl-alcohol dehydrogenase-like predicted oxidoreductase